MGNRTRNTARVVIVPARLRAVRLSKYLSTEDLAGMANVAVGTIRAAEGSERAVHLSTVKALAAALECAPGDISRIDTEDVA